MQIYRTIGEFRAWRAGVHGALGLVPTMGYLHDGHMSLVRESTRDCAATVASIFVNPTQFAPNEDLSRYPRDEARDLALLNDAGVDTVFVPNADEIYPAGFGTYVNVEGLTLRLEGASRPAHFRGVTTVVLKLLNIVQPQRAYFGRKDAQQLAVVRRMVRDLDLKVDVVGLPIVREDDGVAMSSRNVYLSPEERSQAPVLRTALSCAEQAFDAGERDATKIRKAMESMIRSKPLARIDYVSIASAETLEELDVIERTALVSLAAWFGGTRLIDNTTLPFD